jgi:hypothetical protein
MLQYRAINFHPLPMERFKMVETPRGCSYIDNKVVIGPDGEITGVPSEKKKSAMSVEQLHFRFLIIILKTAK